MKSTHFLCSLILATGVVAAAPIEAQRGTPPPAQGRGQSAKPPAPPKTTPATKPATPRGEPATPQGKPATPAGGEMTPGQHLAKQPQLAARLQPLLPPKTDLQLAAAGFKNLGAFVAAVHVSDNLKIPFDQLKLALTGPEPKSLGQAIKELRPGVDATVEVRKAEAQAKRDLDGVR